LAVNKIVLPDEPYRPYKASEAIREIIVSAKNLNAVIEVLHKASRYSIPGKFKGDLSNPLGAMVETPYGKVVIDAALRSKLRKVDAPISPPQPEESLSKLRAASVALIAGLWSVLPAFQNIHIIEVITGIILFLAGTIIARGVG
jgi:hypothetical protein